MTIGVYFQSAVQPGGINEPKVYVSQIVRIELQTAAPDLHGALEEVMEGFAYESPEGVVLVAPGAILAIERAEPGRGPEPETLKPTPE